MECVRQHARVVIHFHPDRLAVSGATVAEALLNTGVYHNQFETGLSSGGLSALPGGPRDSWERTLFGGTYHTEGVTASERPKYGALELIRYPDGPIPRFGSCYLVLRPGVSERTSFTFMGSEDPHAIERLGTIDRMHCVMAALLSEIEEGGMATPPWPPFRTPTPDCRLGIRDLQARESVAIRRHNKRRSGEALLAPDHVRSIQKRRSIGGGFSLTRDACMRRPCSQRSLLAGAGCSGTLIV